MTKNNEVIGENCFRTVASPGACCVFTFQHATVLEQSTEVGFSLILSIYEVV